MKDFAKKALPDLLVIIGFLVIAFVYFFTPLSEGLVLGGHDTVAGLGQGHEQQLFHETTGETTRWTNSIFSGMPTYQIAPSYGPTSLLGKIGWVLGLFTTGPLNYIFIYLLGFYLLMRSLKMRPEVSALGSVLWAFSSYFFIIIAAGHIWKVNTLGFIPPTIAGLVIAYNAHRTDRPQWMQGMRGYALGALVTALFTGLQVLSNHIQMTYYFLFVMALIVLAYGVDAVKQARKAPKLPAPANVAGATTPASVVPTSRFGGFGDDLKHSPLKHWLKATGAIIVGGLLGAAINLPNLYHTYEYSRYSMRGPSELTAATASAGVTTPSADGTDASISAGVTTPSAEAAPTGTGGLDRDYITQWSYGIDETMTLLIPMYKGGGSTGILDREGIEEVEGFEQWRQYAASTQEATQGQLGSSLPGLVQYWGDQPMTVGPVYVGAIACFLFILGLFLVRGPMKWALLLATLLSFLFAWGKNIMPITDFFIDHLPMYNKFRTVSSALVIAEFTIPLLGALGLAEALKQGSDLFKSRRGKAGIIVSLTLTAGLSLIYAIAPSMANNISMQDSYTLSLLQSNGILPPDAVQAYRAAILTMHGSILSASAWRSFWLIVVAAVALFVYVKWPKQIPAWSVVAVLFVVSLVDMWDINRNYLNDDNFETEFTRTEGFSQTPADKTILADKDPDFRVLNLSAGNPFNESDNHTAYWHKSIGGYHAAKLHRYQDLIDRYLGGECQKLQGAISDSYYIIIKDSVAAERFFTEAMEKAPEGTDAETYAQQQLFAEVMKTVNTDSVAPVLNMLNTKWIITGQGGAMALQNPTPNGNAWFLTSLAYVPNANAEIDALKTLNLRSQAVADKQFQQALGAAFTTPTTSAPTSAGVTTPSAAAPASAPTSAGVTTPSAAAPTSATGSAGVTTPSAAPPASAPTSAGVTTPSAAAPASATGSAGVTTPSAAASPSGKATLTSYAPNELHYTIEADKEGVVAFSEIYYPGWTATIDGQPAELGRVNYILRALRVPAGKHEVVMTFHPASLTVTNTVAYASLVILILGFMAMAVLSLRRQKS